MINLAKTLSISPEELSIPDCDVLLYSGCRDCQDDKLLSLCDECRTELLQSIKPMAVYTELPVTFRGNAADFGFAKYESRSLKTFLGGDCNVYIFAATLGIGADRLISRYSSVFPGKAVIVDGCATAGIECFCDYLCSNVFGTNCSERFSPGYGDLPLEMQPKILSVLQTSLNIGLSMTDSMLLTPTKSVTAIVKVHGKKD